MKKVISLLGAFLLVANIYAQSPYKFNYQVTVRDQSNDLVASKPVKLKVVIKSNQNGVVYKEIHKGVTDSNGLLNVVVGDGKILKGNLKKINWKSGAYNIKTALDFNNDSNYEVSGSSKLLSVPYALQSLNSEKAIVAKKIEGGIDKAYINALLKRIVKLEKKNIQIGDFVHGGAVFYIFKKGDIGYIKGETHGLVCAIEDQGSSLGWCSDAVATQHTSLNNNKAIGMGMKNTKAIFDACGKNRYAASMARVYNGQYFTDWFLPSRDELNEMYRNRKIINQVALGRGGTAFKVQSEYYCSSTQDNKDKYNAWVQDFSNGTQHSLGKINSAYCVRSVRAF